jgi:hypothetical protein
MADKVRFLIKKVVTEQFAIIEEAYDENKDVNLDANLRFGFNSKNKAVGVFGIFQFEQKKIPFLKIEVSCHFSIAQSSWDNLMQGETVVFPKDFMHHLGMITVGTARGVLHSKTEGSGFNKFVLPTINVPNLIKGDIVFGNRKKTQVKSNVDQRAR